MDINVKGKRAIVTAGGSGIGRVVAETFVANGANVYVCDIDETVLSDLQQSLPEIGCIKADVSKPDEVDRLFDQALDQMGGLDILVNNAGIAGPTKRFEDITPDEWDHTISVNVNGQFYCARRAVAPFVEAGGGVIVNLSSVAGRLPMPLRAPYSTSKYAVRGFTDQAAFELGPKNIRVNAILPGAVDGPRLRGVIGKQAEAAGVTYQEFLEKALQRISLRTLVSQQEIADMALYLCSDAGRHVSGQSISVCGNFESYERPNAE